jgi:hypothetical protein
MITRLNPTICSVHSTPPMSFRLARSVASHNPNLPQHDVETIRRRDAFRFSGQQGSRALRERTWVSTTLSALASIASMARVGELPLDYSAEGRGRVPGLS